MSWKDDQICFNVVKKQIKQWHIKIKIMLFVFKNEYLYIVYMAFLCKNIQLFDDNVFVIHHRVSFYRHVILSDLDFIIVHWLWLKLYLISKSIQNECCYFYMYGPTVCVYFIICFFFIQVNLLLTLFCLFGYVNHFHRC